ncbi:MAG: hypothetical protein ACKO34_05345, partial [Vampirovibrionales bacterium]
SAVTIEVHKLIENRSDNESGRRPLFMKLVLNRERGQEHNTNVPFDEASVRCLMAQAEGALPCCLLKQACLSSVFVAHYT